jgi:prolyl-tRNA editing enzyme YbaK/EbsC (Cys-tRNA(Pro) deacylase)
VATPEEVKEWLAGHRIAVLDFTERTATATTAAAAVGCSVAEIAKTVLFIVGKTPVAVVTCGDQKVNSSRLKQFFGLSGKVKLPDPGQVEELTGYAPGGVCPFLLPAQLPLVLDQSLRRYERVYAAAGNDRSAVPVTLSQLAELTGAPTADLCSA